MTNRIELTFIPESSFLLGGVSINPAYDSVTALDENNLPYLTATAIKGALRIEFEAFVRGIGEELCDFDADIKGCTKCISCRLFGGGNEEGKLRFNAAVLENADEVLPGNVRYGLLEKGKRQGVSISRTLGKSKDKSYFSTLTFPNLKNIRKITFKTAIDIRRELDNTEKQYLEAFLAMIGETGIFMGSRKSVGLGHFKIDYTFPGQFEKSKEVNTSHKELKLYQITLETLEPLLLGNTKNQYIIDTLPYIPASTLGGTIGFKLSEYGVDDNVLEKMFITDNTFSTFNCYQCSPFPVPLSQRKEKGKEEPVKDILLPDYIINQAIEQDKFAGVQPLFAALYKSNLRPVPICTKPTTFYNTKVAIGRELQKSGEGLLYSMELIPKGVQFKGYIIGETWAVETLKQIKELCMGGKRTRGFGKVRFTDIIEIEITDLINLDNVVDKDLRSLAGDSIKLNSDRRFFTMDLVSDFTLPEDVKDDKRTFERFIMEKLFPGMEIKIEKSFLEVIRRGGYDFRKKRVKPLMECIAAGSTLLVSVPLDRENNFIETLKRMVENSVNYKWDSTPLFRLNSREHIEIWR
ncbi:MAG TPA: RAMP superfamily CRISPR-associated protein [Candidatus Deferrimicrobium sp.]|nr:RAMP superfamily CRISPR-associated protein [Candidatus Deferrimicrobium sp.]